MSAHVDYLASARLDHAIKCFWFLVHVFSSWRATANALSALHRPIRNSPIRKLAGEARISVSSAQTALVFADLWARFNKSAFRILSIHDTIRPHPRDATEDGGADRGAGSTAVNVYFLTFSCLLDFRSIQEISAPAL
jgi:hypothetical protein